ncbi:MAG: CHAT domain-containing protein, partial [bacterium]
MIKILFLAANPSDTTQLRLDQEIRSIDEKLRQSEFRSRFEIQQHWAVRVSDLQGCLLRHRPTIVLFSSHGSSSSEIVLENHHGNSQPVSEHALSQLFSVLKDNIKCVVLNACHSEPQVKAIANHIDCVIGMSKEISDSAAISFSASFYQALGYRRDIKTAFYLGCGQIDLEDLSEKDTPKLWTLKKDPGKIFLFTKAKPARLPDGLSPIWSVPFDRNPYFTGREEILTELREKMIVNKAMALSQPHALCGFGGIGKTQTAVEYCYRFRNEYQVVLWVTADSKDVLFSDFISLASVLNLPQKEADDQQLIFDIVKQWLNNNSDWLLIFDNADNPDLLKPYLPHNPNGHILLTSRAQMFESLGMVKPISVNKMTLDEANEFLIKRTGKKHTADKELKSMKQLAAELDYLPLALEQAGAYITRKQCLFENYLSSYKNRGLRLLERYDIDPDIYPQSVATTWLMNFEQVERTSKAAADLFRVSAFLYPDSIPFEFITSGTNELGPHLSKALSDYEADPLLIDEIMEPLTQYSLIHRDIQSQTYDIHRLVQAVYRETMDN